MAVLQLRRVGTPLAIRIRKSTNSAIQTDYGYENFVFVVGLGDGLPGSGKFEHLLG
jgi:hypothetical protein